MNVFLRRHKKLHIWLLTDLILLALFFLTRGHRAWMNAVADRVTTPLRRTVGTLCARVPFSVMEALCIALAAFAAVYLVWSVAAVIRAKGRRGGRAYSAVLGAVCIALTVYVGFCFLWGVNYYTDSFQDKSGIRAEKVSVENLTKVTEYFAARLNDTADGVDRNQKGLFSVSRDRIFQESTSVYDSISKTYPFLKFHDNIPKRVHFSRFMSMLDFTGVYCPYTGETNLNVDSPACLLPSTIAHELAHQRSIASEQECNFLAVLASTTCGKEDYSYSGWLLGYIYLGNALYKADRTAWKTVYASLPDTVWADLTNNNEYWDRFQSSTAKKVSNKVYDSFLKGYGEEKGLQSYGTVVDMLVAYYKNLI